MRVIDADAFSAAVDMPAMIEAMRGAFASTIIQPVRHHHTLARSGRPDQTLLLMPAWHGGDGSDERIHVGVKIVTVMPDNHLRAMPTVQGTYLLLDGAGGEPLAAIDGTILTLWRTAAASALAASYLARRDARRHLVVGAGAMSAFLARAMRDVRPIETTLLWNRNPDRAESVAATLRSEGLAAESVADLGAAIAVADIVSTATLSTEPLVLGDALRPGTHLDLVGAFSPAMRECDDRAVARSSVFVDTREGALSEGGDLVQAMASGAFNASDVRGDLADLVAGRVAGRQTAEEITLFKSVGAAREDLAAAVLVYERIAASAIG